MTSGDIVFEADDLGVRLNLSGSKPFHDTGFRTAYSANDGWRVAFGGSVTGGSIELADLFFGATSGTPSSPFDSAKTYDVIIKEH